MNRSKKGFTLIELLIVVAIIGIIVAIAIPNLLNAIQRAKQKRSMADMRSAGTAAESYSIDYNQYPPSATGALPGSIAYGNSAVYSANFQKYVEPTYIQHLPLTDGWNSWFLYVSDGKDYAIGCVGKNGTAQTTLAAGATTNFNDDIVFADGQFLIYPEGVQN